MTITLTEGELEITSSITINGLGADQLTISGGGVSRVFTEVGNGLRIITITDMTIADGLAPSSTGGGAFFANGANATFRRVVMTNNNSLGNNGSAIVSAFGTLEITDSAIVNNLNTGVGAIRLQDNTTVITNTTISGNGTRGISIFNSSSNADRLSLANVTIANNANEGIEVVAFASTTLLEYQNTLFTNNGGQGSIDARGNDAGLPGLSIVSLSHNLLDDTPTGVATHAAAPGDLRNTNPLLAPLADNGGPTPTHALLVGSPAIDAGNSLLTIDQRGVARPADLAGVPNASGGNGSDIGAFETYGPLILPGDYNLDGRVDAADYTMWRDQLGATGVIPFTGPDGNGDGQVTQDDYVVWRNNYGATLPPSPQAEVAGTAVAPAAHMAFLLLEPPLSNSPQSVDSDPAQEAEGSPEVDEAAFDLAFASVGRMQTHPSLLTQTARLPRVSQVPVDDLDLLLPQPNAAASHSDQKTISEPSRESDRIQDEPASVAAVGSSLERLE
jgi:hypothetical protein